MKTSNRNQHTPISVLSLPPRHALIQTPSPSHEYTLYLLAARKRYLEAVSIQVSKTRLFSNLEIYEWRSQTEFPIAKTKYVSIKRGITNSAHASDLTVFTEHCPLRLTAMDDLNESQFLYMLKQAMVGFERLYDRFGAFQIDQNMIAIDERGHCRVWLNRNFAANSPALAQGTEHTMVVSIQNLLEKHAGESKNVRKILAKTKHCKTFLAVLKEIGNFASREKITIPNKFIFKSSRKNSNFCNLLKSANSERPHFTHQQNARTSLISNRFQQDTAKNGQSSLSHRGSEIKRFKSQDKIKVSNLKISGGQTAHTRNRETKASNTGNYNSPRETSYDRPFNNLVASKNPRRWMEQSSFVMELEGEQTDRKQKKQLSHSQAVIKINQQVMRGPTVRKFSENENSFQNKLGQPAARNSNYDNFVAEISSILDNNEMKCSSATPRKHHVVEEVDEDRYKEEITDVIMKNNGWSSVNTIMDLPAELKRSIHQGQEDAPRREIKLDKLDSIGRRPVTMSILPEQYEDII